ncbi:MAG TPA: hypothetical protein VGG04_18665 [Candidatus Sulfotelmatobacter sp.]|jgi:hypothetical protein
MKDIRKISQQKESELAQVRKEIESLHVVAPLLADDPSRGIHEVLQKKEAEVANVRKEVESLRLVAPMISDEPASDELTRKPASSAQETPDHSQDAEATGTDDLFSSMNANPRPKFWEILKRKT